MSQNNMFCTLFAVCIILLPAWHPRYLHLLTAEWTWSNVWYVNIPLSLEFSRIGTINVKVIKCMYGIHKRSRTCRMVAFCFLSACVCRILPRWVAVRDFSFFIFTHKYSNPICKTFQIQCHRILQTFPLARPVVRARQSFQRPRLQLRRRHCE